VQELKIDRTFITDLTPDSRSAAIVRSTIDLAHTLGLSVVAEGVENADSFALLRRFDCDLVQGYHFCRPHPAADLTRWLRTQRARMLDPAAATFRLSP
jgi:EAL domain-containing protein (putative c-di-GMP-specific phosphodiesterase class I)